jgi:hypothetical protein
MARGHYQSYREHCDCEGGRADTSGRWLMLGMAVAGMAVLAGRWFSRESGHAAVMRPAPGMSVRTARLEQDARPGQWSKPPSEPHDQKGAVAAVDREWWLDDIHPRRERRRKSVRPAPDTKTQVQMAAVDLSVTPPTATEPGATEAGVVSVATPTAADTSPQQQAQPQQQQQAQPQPQPQPQPAAVPDLSAPHRMLVLPAPVAVETQWPARRRTRTYGEPVRQGYFARDVQAWRQDRGPA